MLLSGGIDSATCLYMMRQKGYERMALTIRFHRMARGELLAATRIAAGAGVVEHRFVSIPQLREAGDLKGAHRLAGLVGTYIPMKNAIYYSIAAAYAEEVGARYLVGGHNREDTRLFDDTRERFFGNLQEALRSGSRRLEAAKLTIWRPLRRMSKEQVVTLADELGVPLGLTWSCHREGSRHCWKCAGCVGRLEAFRRAGVEDPLRQHARAAAATADLDQSV